MLKSYEITLEGDKVKWLGEKPKTKITQAILVVEEKKEVISSITPPKRSTPEHLKGKVKILGDIVNPIYSVYLNSEVHLFLNINRFEFFPRTS